MPETLVLERTHLRTRTARVLTDILDSGPEVHGSWLATLSLLEFTGARKIAATFVRPQGDVLTHLAEEARHARFFGAMAERVRRRSPEPAAPPQPFAGRAGLLYFHRLDDGIARDVRERLPADRVRPAIYYHVTRAVEERALDLYEDYNVLLRERSTGLRLDRVIAEERGHLTEMNAALTRLDPEQESAGERYRTLEHELFAGFLDALEAALAAR